MTLNVKVGSQLRTIQTLYVKVGGTLKQLNSLKVKVGSQLRELLVLYSSPWSGMSVDDFLLGAGNVVSSFAVRSNGECASSSLVVSGNWVSPAFTGIGSQYQIMYTIVTGPSGQLSVVAPSAGTWHSLSSDFSISVSNNGSNQYFGSLTVAIQIRRVADSVVTNSGNLTLSVTRES